MKRNDGLRLYKDSNKNLPAPAALGAAEALNKMDKNNSQAQATRAFKPRKKAQGDIKSRQLEFLEGFAKLAQLERFDFMRAQWRDGEVVNFVRKNLADIEWSKVPAVLAHLRARNTHGQDIYFRAARGYPSAVVLIDDVPRRLALAIAAKYRSYVIETSPDSCHVWIGTDRVLDEEERYNSQKHIIQRGVGDPGSVSGEHSGRLPGTRNHKRGSGWVNVIAEPDPNVPLYRPVLTPAREQAPSSPRLFFRGSSPAQRLNGRRSAARSNKSGRDESAQEWGFVCGQLEHGVSAEVVRQRLLNHCRERRGRDAERYVDYTIRRARARVGK